jgi:hypothetical protein
MNILRGGVAAIFVIIFSASVAVFVTGFCLERAATPQTAKAIIERARVGRIISSILPGIIVQYLSETENIKLRVEDISLFTNKVLKPEEINIITERFSSAVIQYIRGQNNTVPKIDFASIETRAVYVGKKQFPRIAGEQFSGLIISQFKKLGISNGWQMPREGLDSLKTNYLQFIFDIKIALVTLLVALLVIFIIAPNGIFGRMRWCGSALAIAGFLMAIIALGISIVSGVIINTEFMGKTPPQIVDMIKVGLGALAEMLTRDVLIAAIICFGVGLALTMLGFVLRKHKAFLASKKPGQIIG